MKTAIFLYNLTDYMVQPWIDKGWQCYSFDSQHKGDLLTYNPQHMSIKMEFGKNNIINFHEIANVTGLDVDFVFGFPPCTDLAVSGARHFESKKQVNPNFQSEAINLARLVELCGNTFNCPWGLENPVSVMATQWRKPDYSFHPYEYGGYLPEDDRHPDYPEYIQARDAYPKKTCIWAGNGFIMPPKKAVIYNGGFSTQYKKLGGKSLKTKNIRSATPRGFAKAVGEFNA
jgi:hypothetical protein